jgi:hypothetical protein
MAGSVVLDATACLLWCWKTRSFMAMESPVVPVTNQSGVVVMPHRHGRAAALKKSADAAIYVALGFQY